MENQYFTPILVSNPKFDKACIYKVITANKGAAYMRVSHPSNHRDGTSILWVDTSKLVQLWRNDSRTLGMKNWENYASPETWVTDYKFEEKDPEFNRNFRNPDNPVTLSLWIFEMRQISQPIKRKIFCLLKPVDEIILPIPCAGPDIGMTRSLWLINAGARAFPILLNSFEEAQGLYKYAGILGRPPQTLLDIWSTATSNKE